MNISLIAMDFDGTLLRDDKSISEKTMEVLKSCHEQGYFIVGVTARAFLSAKEVIPFELFDYLILNNGAYFYDVHKHEGKAIDFLTRDVIQSIKQDVTDSVTKIDYVTWDTYYTSKEEGRKRPFIKQIEDISEIEDDILRMNLFFSCYEEVLYYRKFLQEKYPAVHCFCMQESGSSKIWLVINPKNLDKKTALKYLGSTIHVELQDMLFFGDGLNDFDVMNAVGFSVAMQNALPEIKNIAQEITFSNNEDGIAHFLEKNLLYTKKQ